MGIVERIKEIEAEMARTQKNKATGNFHSLITKAFIVPIGCVLYYWLIMLVSLRV